RIDDGRALPNFLSQALRGEPLTVYGDGGQTRSFCYVSDLVEGIYRMMLSNDTGPINLGNPEEIPVLQMAREVIRLTGSKSKMRFEALPADDPHLRKPDISKASSVLGWQPKVSRREGIRRVIPYFKSKVETATGFNGNGNGNGRPSANGHHAAAVALLEPAVRARPAVAPSRPTVRGKFVFRRAEKLPLRGATCG